MSDPPIIYENPLQSRRQNLGLSIDAVARRTGLSHSGTTRALRALDSPNGCERLPLGTFVLLCRALEVDPLEALRQILRSLSPLEGRT